MTTIANVSKTSGRHFYAVKDTNGKEVAYVFNTIAERSSWMEKNENSKPVTAFEVYQLMNKNGNEALIANRRNRVMKVSADAEIFPEKGQRLIRQ